jgi:hypothetical protein
MSLSSVDATSSQSAANLLIQQLLSSGTSAQGSSGDSGILGDLMTLSPAAQQLTQAPTAVTQAMSDLFSGQQNVQADLVQLKSYFQQNPQSLSAVLSSLQNGTSTYGASGSLGSNSALLAALMNGQSSSSNSGALLTALLGGQSQDPLLASLGSSGDGSSGSSVSLFG